MKINETLTRTMNADPIYLLGHRLSVKANDHGPGTTLMTSITLVGDSMNPDRVIQILGRNKLRELYEAIEEILAKVESEAEEEE